MIRSFSLSTSLDGERVAVTPGAAESDREIAAFLRGLEPPMNARRQRGETTVSFEDAARLATLSNTRVDSLTERRIANRLALAAEWSSVTTAAREVMSQGRDRACASITDTDLAARLDDHQAVNVAVMTLSNSWGTCVFDEQGTGKTLSVVAAFDILVERDLGDVLVVIAPKSMIAEWAEEFREFLGNRYRVAVLQGGRTEKARAIDSGADVIVLNYESCVSMAANLATLARRTRTILAVDESFFVKNPDAIRSQAVAEFREWCVRCFVLCGTPAPNAPEDIIAQFDLVDFGRTFRGIAIPDDRDDAALLVRSVLDGRGVYLRSLKRVTVPDLPKRRFTEATVTLAPLQQQAYSHALDGLILDLQEVTDAEFQRTISSYLAKRNALLRICSDPSPVIPGYEETPAKIEMLDRLLVDLIEKESEKVVLWSYYRASLDRISNRYRKYGVARIDGSIGDIAVRRDAVQRFQKDDETRLFIGNPAAAGAGLTLHRSRVAIYESFPNQAAHYLQSLDRIHRRGQDRQVEYIALTGEGTIEKAEYRRLLEKADRQADLLGDPQEPRPSRQVMLEELLASKTLLPGG